MGLLMVDKNVPMVAIVLAIVMGILMMFVGIFMISTVSGLFPNQTLYSCTYATTTNSTTSPDINSTISTNRTFSVTTFSQHCPASQGGYLSVTMQNETAETGVLTVGLNGNYIRNITIPATSSTTTITGITVVPSTVNNVTYTADTTGSVNISSDTMVTSSTEVYTSMGQIHANTVAVTSTVFGVIGLFLTLIGISFAVKAMRGAGAE